MTAILVRQPATGQDRTFPDALVTVRATEQWRAPGGQLRTGPVPVVPGAGAGSILL